MRHDRAPWPIRVLSSGHTWSVLALIVLCVATHRGNFEYGLLGFDTFPQIIASRIASVDDVVGTFTEELADGRLLAKFYRPVQNLSIAFDHALWGLAPLGYQVHSLIAYVACVVLVYAVARRVLGAGAWLAAAVGAAFYALHPSLMSVVPVPCRRSDILVSVFLLFALWVLPLRGDTRTWWRFSIAGVFVMFAGGAKDIGVMGLGLVFLHQFFLRSEGGFRRDLRRSLAACIPTLIGVVLYLINRTYVLGGFGGYQRPKRQAEPYWDRFLRYGQGMITDLLCPWLPIAHPEQEGMRVETIVALIVGAILFVLAAVAALIALRRRAEQQTGTGVLLVLGLAWLIPPAIVLGMLVWYGPWYAPLPAVGIALLVAGLTHAAVTRLRPRGRGKPIGVVLAASVVGVAVLALHVSPLWTGYNEWARATAVLQRTLREIDDFLSTGKNGDTKFVRTMSYYHDRTPPADRPALKWVAVVAGHGLKAYADLTHPEKNVRLANFDPRRPQHARLDEMLIVWIAPAPKHTGPPGM